jgi:hypothetical protein
VVAPEHHLLKKKLAYQLLNGVVDLPFYKGNVANKYRNMKMLKIVVANKYRNM